MGKARIIGGGTDGLYQAVIEHDTERLDARIESIEAEVVKLDQELPILQVALLDAKNELDSAISDRDLVIFNYNQGSGAFADIQSAQSKIYPLIPPFTDATREVKAAKFKRISLIQEKKLLESSVPGETTLDLWCADLTESLDPEAVVPTIDVKGESQAVIISPQFVARSWDSATDGVFQPVYSSGPSAVWVNWSLLPGWQKWLPTYRIGTITAITLDTCGVILDSSRSSQQNININQAESLVLVPIDYMDCGAGAFDVGDRVVVAFENQDWNQPKVIGFESNPKPCAINDFAMIPRSDDAPDGWGTPATDGSGTPINGGLGTVGGSSPWITIRTAGYTVTRFISSVEHGNLYYKPKDIDLPIISWVGPQNGYLKNATGMTTFGLGGPFQQSFGRSLYSGRKKIAESDLGQYIIGAAIRKQGAEFRLILITQDGSGQVRLAYADVVDLNFDSQVVGWVTVTAPTNPDVAGGEYKSDGVASFNKSGTKSAWMWGGDGYEWDVDSNSISRLNLSESQADDNPSKPRINITDAFSNFVDDPCGGPDPWPTETTQTETLTQDWSRSLNIQRSPVCIDYAGDDLLVLWKESGTRESEAFDYSSTHSHTRPEICGRGFDDALETVTFSGSATGSDGQFFKIGATAVTGSDYGERTFSGGTGEMVGVSATDQDANARMRIRVGGLSSQDTFRQIERESFIRHADLKAGVVIATASETESNSLDTDGMQIWTQRRVHFLMANGTRIDFWTETVGTFREEDILDENGNVIVLDPRQPVLDFEIASDRYSSKVLCSILDSDGATLLNYLTGDDPVTVTQITGSNPRFSPITIL
jgi:hypothetical protein